MKRTSQTDTSEEINPQVTKVEDITGDILKDKIDQIYRILVELGADAWEKSPSPWVEINTPHGSWEFHKDTRENALTRQREEIVKSFRDEVIGKIELVGLPVTQVQEQRNYDKRIRNELRAEQCQKLDELLK